jgi:hypothetical protein
MKTLRSAAAVYLLSAAFLSIHTSASAATAEIATDESNINSQAVFNGGIFRCGTNTIFGEIDPRMAAGDKRAFTEIFRFDHDKKTGGFSGYNENAGLSRDLITSRELEGVKYSEFLLNVNEQGKDTVATLETFQIYTSESADETGFDFSGMSLDYDMDDPENGIDNTINFSYEFAGGKGQSAIMDLIIYIPQSYLSNQYVYINIGLSGLTNGWDELLYFTEPVPEPATAFIMVLGGLMTLSRRKR